MNRISISKKFISTLFNKGVLRDHDLFIRENGLMGFPNVIKSDFKKELMIYTLKKERLKKLLKLFFKKFNSSDFIFFKGYDIEKYYPASIFRVYTDIDLLCRKEIFNQIELPIDDHSKLFIEKDINIEVKYNFYDPYFEHYMKRKQKRFLKYFYANNKNEISKEFNLILLSIHNFQHQFSRLDRFFDLYYILRDNLDIQKTMSIAKEYGVDFFVRYNLYLMKNLDFPVKIQKEYERITEIEKYLLEKLFNTNKSRYKLFLLMLKFNPLQSIIMFFEKVLFLDMNYIRHIRHRRVI
ncbi:nucleotidyltransferase family protein [bacterium]|nr:nucleotidyltransferase family protein [bacterium]